MMNTTKAMTHFYRIVMMWIWVGVLAACAAPVATPIEPTLARATRPLATATQIPTFTAMPTLVPTRTPEPKPTQAPLQTDEHRAPNGWWSAQGWGEFRGETYHAELRVTRADGLMTWTAAQEFSIGLGLPLPTPLEWSQDGRYLYYTNTPLVDGCAMFVNGSDLWRMDLSDGTATQLVPEVGLAVSLAPDEKTFAYISFGPRQDLVLRDLAAGNERRAPLPADTQAGGIVWSLDSSVLMLTVAEKPCSREIVTSILRMDVATLNQTAVPIEGDGKQWVTLEWGGHGRVLLTDYNGHSAWLNPVNYTLEKGVYRSGTLASPDLKWVAVTLPGSTNGNVQMEVLQIDSPQMWLVSQEYLGMGGSLSPLRWTPEGRYLYFTLVPAFDGCGAWPFKGKDLYRLDIETGKVVEVTHNVWVGSVSPNAKWVIYVEGKDIVLLDLTTEIKQRKTLDVYSWGEHVWIGNFVWSPDSKSFLIAVELDSCTETISSSIVQIDRSKLTEAVMIRGMLQRFRVRGWIDDETVWLRDDAGYGNYWLFNPLTGELTTPTLVPQNLSPY